MKKLSQLLKVGGQIAKASVLRKKVPLSVTVSITNRCNMQCNYCTVWRRKQEDMKTGQVLAMVDEFSRMGCIKMSFSGGEPLLRDDIEEIISHASSLGLFLTMTTNGTMIYKRIDALKKLNVLLVSLDGPDDIQRNTRKYSTTDIINQIRIARNAGIRVWTSSVITNRTLEHIDSILDVAREMGLRALFQPLSEYTHLTAQQRVNPSIMPSEAYVKDVLRKLIERKSQGSPVANSIPYLRHVLEKGILDGTHCLAGKRFCFVDANGDVFRCSLLTDIATRFNGPELGFREAFRRCSDSPCRGCNLPCFLEYHFLFKINPRSILNMLHNV